MVLSFTAAFSGLCAGPTPLATPLPMAATSAHAFKMMGGRFRSWTPLSCENRPYPVLKCSSEDLTPLEDLESLGTI